MSLYDDILVQAGGNHKMAGDLHEQLWQGLLRREEPHFHNVRPARGDGGIDGFILKDPVKGSAIVFQAKFFPEISSVQHRKAIVEAFARAHDHNFDVAEWCLLLPVSVSHRELDWLVGGDLKGKAKRADNTQRHAKIDSCAISYRLGSHLQDLCARHPDVAAEILPKSSLVVPPTLGRRVSKALGALVSGLVDAPAAWIAGKVQTIRDETAASSHLNLATGVALKSVDQFTSDPKLVQRATHYFGARLISEQENREAVAAAAMEALRSDRSQAQAASEAEIDGDWLNMFARVAETKSNADMRQLLGQILAGEIRKPGSFSPSTIESVAKLTVEIANSFRSFCCISTVLNLNVAHVIAEPFGEPGENALAPFGFSFETICDLQHAGLVHTEFTSWVERTSRELNDTMIFIGGKPFGVSGRPKRPQKIHRMKVLNFTRAGLELRRIVPMEPSVDYLDKFRSWLNDTMGLKLQDIDQRRISRRADGSLVGRSSAASRSKTRAKKKLPSNR